MTQVMPRTLAFGEVRGEGHPDVKVHRIVDHGASGAHDHLFHEMVVVESGSAVHVTAEGERRLRPGDVIVIRPQVWHRYAKPQRLTIINCLMSTRLTHQFRGMLAQVKGLGDLLLVRPRKPAETAPTVIHASPAQRRAILDRLELIMQEQRKRSSGWEAAVTLAMLDVVVSVARIAEGGEGKTEGAAQATGSRIEQAVMDAAAHIESHFRGAASLRELSRVVHLSEGHLSRSFAKRMGMGVIQFMHRLRAEEACRLLRTTDWPVARIAAAVGYDEVAYFSRCFRREIGVSAREYRRRV